MLRLFKKKKKSEKAQIRYEKLLKEAYQLSSTDRKASDAKTAQAEEVLREIELLREKGL